ncbi:MAG: integrase core domain-containing protein, partial [Nitrospinota bacterium]
APPKSLGRKPLDQETVNIILELKSLNPSWGAQKISDELAKVGYKASKKTVLKYLEINGLNGPAPLKTLRWSEFLGNHKFKIGIDFTSMISLAGHQLFVFVIINLDSRKLLFINATYSPHMEWVTQQFRNAFYELEEYPSLCLCDRDTIFSGWFIKMMDDYFKTKVRQIPYKSPWKNGRVERFHLSLKREVFANVVPIGVAHTMEMCRTYQRYYNNFRPHQGINGEIPSKLREMKPANRMSYRKEKHLRGKITSLEPGIAVAA